ncbi:MAG: VWA domain-containing protein [Deltaproteobacteria bacterium]|nr:VWA domain-containing protein [Deltaproteobacteria bacterium]
MSTQRRRNVTVGLMALAGVIAVVALALAGRSDRALVARLDPRLVDPHPVHPPRVATVKPPVVPTRPTVAPEPPRPVAEEKSPQVDLVFAVDTTGSMSGLLAGAKRKIWSIANQVLSGQPKPHVRIGLIGYRDVGDAYVTRRYALSEEVDDVYKNLQGFEAAGGGDTPEHVNRALAEAIRNMQWRDGKDVLRLIFLVGDAPPHEGRGGLYSKELAREASQKGIVINAVRCGEMEETATAWRGIARVAGGMYASIQQDGGMVAMATPHDRRLAELNRKLSATLLPSGSGAEKDAARERARSNLSMDEVAQAESATYRARRGAIDGADLLSKLGRGRALGGMAARELPPQVAALPAPARQAYVDRVARERKEVQEEIAKLAKARDGYLKTRRKSVRSDAFDDKVGEALKAQGPKAGIAY